MAQKKIPSLMEHSLLWDGKLVAHQWSTSACRAERKGLLSQEGQCLLFSLPRSARQHKLQGNGELNIIALKLFNILLG